jgi:membrane-bound lytic murein transglycosylase MltF
LVLHLAEHVTHKVEIQRLELQVSHSTWLHTVEAQHKVTDNLDQMVQELKIELVLVQAVAVKQLGRIHGELAVAVAEQAELENMETVCSLTLEDTQDISEDQELLLKDLQAEAQDGQTQMILQEDKQADVDDQVYMVLLVAVAEAVEV